MSAPYREVGIPDGDRLGTTDEVAEPLATFDVSGDHGSAGQHGGNGSPASSSGGYGRRGADAGQSSSGIHAGRIRIELSGGGDDGVVALRGEMVGTAGDQRPIKTTIVIDERGYLGLGALGGNGGDGGNGGHGGDGARGSSGSDATRYSDGGDGGSGGAGGAGGNATSGSDGGRGGAIVVAVSDDDSPLLMLVRYAVDGGTGGQPGRNGTGGSGGSGGSGGDSYSWTTSSSYRDSNGNSQTRTHYHRNSGGSSGANGSRGMDGSARVVAGKPGALGSFAIEVTTADGVVSYDARYDLRLAAFAHDSLNEDCVYEPREVVRVFDLEVENVGGMPTPAKDDLELSLVAGGWVIPEPGELLCPRGLAAAARAKVPGELRFRIRDHSPNDAHEPLEVEESILHRAVLPSVRRGFDDYQAAAALEAGRFVIRYPIRAQPVANLRSLIAGEGTRVRFSLVNQSRFALGATSECKRVLRIRVAAASDTELGDDVVGFTASGTALAPSTGWTHEIDRLDAGETIALELTLDIKPDAPEYRRFVGRVSLEIGGLDVPTQTRAIQYRAFDIRVARPFRVSDADLLLVVNHRTTRDEIDAWEALAERLAVKLAIWDLTRERHLDLEKPLDGEVSLAAWFADKAIVILDNTIDGPDGPIHPHDFLCSDQAIRAAATGIDIAFIGTGPALDKLLIPGPLPAAEPSSTALAIASPDGPKALVAVLRDAPRATASIHRRYWIRFWATPQPAWLERQAHKLAKRIQRTYPEQRHVVVHRFASELQPGSRFFNRWKVGTIETVRTLDAAAGSIVHAAVGDETIHDPAYPASGAAAVALLAMFGFGENLARLARAIAADHDAVALDRIVDALLVDLGQELGTVLWRGAATTPRLDALASSGVTAGYDTTAGKAVIRLVGRLRFLARSQVSWWEAIPPFGWLRRAPQVRRRVARATDQLLAGAFGDHNLATLRAEAILLDQALWAEHKIAKQSGVAGKRRSWAFKQILAPITEQAITSDTELLARSEERVLSGEEYDRHVIERTAAATQRAQLIASAEREHADLVVH